MKNNITDLVTHINGTSKKTIPLEKDVFLEDIFDMKKFNDHIENGMINRSQHPDYPLDIYKYSSELMYSQEWDEITLQCRGLIVERTTNKIISRGFNKFFNMNELPKFDIQVSRDDNCIIMPKEDGSLGIIYYYDGEYRVSTAGSLVSEQALHATRKLQEIDFTIPRGYNFIVEIIYPENRIVTNYGDRDDLILLGATNNYGHWISPEELHSYWNGTIVDYKKGTVNELLNSKDPEDTREGFVARLDNGLMVKMKYPHYLTLHKIKYSISYNTVLESMLNNDFKEYRLSIPDEFAESVDKYAEDIFSRVEKLDNKVQEYVEKMPTFDNKKDKALWIEDNVPKNLRTYMRGIFLSENNEEEMFKKYLKSKNIKKEKVK